MTRIKSATYAVGVTFVYAYVLNNIDRGVNHVPNFVWWMFPEYVWFHVNYYIVFPLACLMVVGIPTFLFFRLVDAITRLAVKQ